MMRKILSIVIVLMLITSCTTVKFEEHTDAGSKYVLNNGMTLLLKENHDTGMVALDFMIKRGLSADGEQPGISYFTNKMLLAGTEKRKREDIAKEIENVGGSIKAKTLVEYSEIVLEVPSESLSVALDLLQDVIQNPSFSPEEVEKEREAIIGELESKKDQPNVVTEELFLKLMYEGHPYQNPIDGYVETVKKITREDIVKHYSNWYTGNNAILSIVGNIREKNTLNAVNKAFKKIPALGLIEEIPLPKVHTAPKQETQNMPLESYYIQTGYQLVPATHPDFIKLRIAHAILGSGSGSRLFYELRDKRALAYSVRSILPSIRTTGFIKITMISRPEVVNESIAGIKEQVEKLKTEQVPEEEMKIVKQKLKGFFALDHQKTVDQANYLAIYEMQGQGYHYDVEYPDKLDEVTSNDVKEVAQKYFYPPITAIVGPFEGAKIE